MISKLTKKLNIVTLYFLIVVPDLGYIHELQKKKTKYKNTIIDAARTTTRKHSPHTLRQLSATSIRAALVFVISIYEKMCKMYT